MSRPSKRFALVVLLSIAVLSAAHEVLAFANTVTTGDATGVTSFEAKLNGMYTLDSSRTVETYFIYGTSPEIQQADFVENRTMSTKLVSQPAQETGTFSEMLRGLEPYQPDDPRTSVNEERGVYYYKAIVWYNDLISKSGELKSFKTLPLSGNNTSGGQVRPDPVPTEEGGLVLCKENCGYREAVAMIQKIIDFLLYVLALPIAAVMFAYAGFIYMKSGGGEKSKAKTIFWNVFIGLAIALAAWLIVNTVIESLLSEEAKQDGGYNLLTQ